jgi:hypothetical protein
MVSTTPQSTHVVQRPRLHDLVSQLHSLWQRWVGIFVPVRRVLSAPRLYREYLASWRDYQALPDAEPLRLFESYPCFGDKTVATSFDSQYLYQAVWATEQISCSSAQRHIDIGSDIKFVALLTTRLPVIFIDIRPLYAPGVSRLRSVAGNIIQLPFADRSVESLSCLHVAEHIGLGRYGDALNPDGTRAACTELGRVLAPGGSLFFSVPIGRPRVCFNAHRVHSPQQILDYFQELSLVRFAAINDHGAFLERVTPSDLAQATYSCGLFHFTRN